MRKLGMLSLLVCAAANQMAYALESPDNNKLEEVIVTAQKREASLQQVPISVQVMSAEALQQSNLSSLSGLAETLPAVHISTGAFSNDVFIRGIGSGQNQTFDQSVAMFTDDVYHGRSRLSESAFLDLSRVEILKGPQSTFFGNNAVAGAVNLIAAKPGDQFDGFVRLLYGDFDQYQTEAAIGGPVTDTLGMRLAVIRSGSSGWIDNVFTGKKAPVTDNLAGRLTTTFDPTDALSITLKLEAGDNSTSGTAFGLPAQWVNCPPPAPMPPTFAAGPGGGCVGALQRNVPVGLESSSNATIPGEKSELSTRDAALSVDYRIGMHQLTSVTAYTSYDFSLNLNNGYLPTFALTTQFPEEYEQFSQELRLASETGGALEYMVGAYFQKDTLNFGGVANSPFLNGFGALIGVPAQYLPLSILTDAEQDEDVYSAFGSLTWNISETLKATAGLRRSWVSKETTGVHRNGTSSQVFGGFTEVPAQVEQLWGRLLPFGPIAESKRSDDAWMPSVGVQYFVRPEAMIYAQYNRGFKAGGINVPQANAIVPDPEYGPETVDAFEVGIKSKWFDDTLLLNFDVFRMDYSGLQVIAQVLQPALNVYAQVVRNAANAVSQGAEFEAEWLVANGFKVAANVTYLDSHYTDYPNAAPIYAQQFCRQSNTGGTIAYCNQNYPNPVSPVFDASGQPTAFAPKWSGSLALSYSHDVFSNYRATAQLSTYATSRHYANGGSGDPFFQISGYGRLDGRISIESLDGRLGFDIIGKNLTDRVIQSTQYLFYQASREQPRSLVAQVRYNF